ncbi:MAG: hypothetical protein VW405_03670 [Rhodospirillaceae bacterium]
MHLRHLRRADGRTFLQAPPFPPAKAFEILESMSTGIDQNLLMLFKDIFGGDPASGL